jgi:hypothetical protein
MHILRRREESKQKEYPLNIGMQGGILLLVAGHPRLFHLDVREDIETVYPLFANLDLWRQYGRVFSLCIRCSEQQELHGRN